MEVQVAGIVGSGGSAAAEEEMRAAAVIVIALGLYLVLDHADPFPLNHEAIGLGKQHLAHVVGGLVLLVGGVLLWRRGRRVSAA